MSKIIGRLNNIGIGKESVRGTAVAPTIWMPQLEPLFEARTKNIINEASIGRLEDSDGEVVSLVYGEVSLKSKVKDKSFGYLLLSLLGSVTSTAKSAPNAVVYDHVFAVGQTTQHQSLSVALKGPNDDYTIANAVCDSIKLKAETGNFLMFEASLMGKAPAASTTTATYTAENDFWAKHITFKKAALQSGLAGASAVSIRKFEMEIKSNVILEEVLGSSAPSDILNQSFGITGSVTLVHNDNSYSTLMTAGTYQALRFDIQNTDTTIGTSANPGLQIDLNRCIISGYERKMTNKELVEESFNFTAHYSMTDGKMLIATLTNLQAAY